MTTLILDFCLFNFWLVLNLKTINNLAQDCAIGDHFRLLANNRQSRLYLDCKNLEKSAICTQIFERWEGCKGVHCVDLGESCPMHIFLQKLA